MTRATTVYVVFADAEEAARIGRSMVEERLAACINILGDIRSIYRWQGKVEEADEVAALFKTSSETAVRLIGRIAELHSYDVPCIECWPADKVPESFARWVDLESGGQAG